MKTIWQLLQEKFNEKKVTVEEFRVAIEQETRAGHNVVAIKANPTRVIEKSLSRNQLSVAGHKDNTGYVYIGFDSQTSTTNYCQRLAPDDSFIADNFRGELWACVDTLNEKVCLGEW